MDVIDGLALQVYEGVYNLDYAVDYFGYELNVETRNVAIMAIIGIVYRIISLLLMIFLNRRKQR
jgi:hypothetical protein